MPRRGASNVRQTRDRTEETGIPLSYLQALRDEYERFVEEMAKCTAVYRLNYEAFCTGEDVWAAIQAVHRPGAKGVFVLDVASTA